MKKFSWSDDGLRRAREAHIKSEQSRRGPLLKEGFCFCPSCKEYKRPEEFHESIRNRKFKSGYCKACKSGYEKNRMVRIRFLASERRRLRPAEHRWHDRAGVAKKKGLAIMSKAEFVAWWDSQDKICVYCGMGNEACKALYSGKGLNVDRKDNSKGYITGNIAFACHRCNMVKSSHLTYDQMMTVAEMFFRPKLAAAIKPQGSC